MVEIEAPLGLNFGSSVVKRETRTLDSVTEQLQADGWVQTGSLGGRVKYFEKTGFNLTAVEGPFGTVVFPSGPLRGRLFGSNSGLQVNREGVIGTGRVEGERGAQKRNSAREAGQMI